MDSFEILLASMVGHFVVKKTEVFDKKTVGLLFE